MLARQALYRVISQLFGFAFAFFITMILGVESKASHMPGKGSTIKKLSMLFSLTRSYSVAWAGIELAILLP